MSYRNGLLRKGLKVLSSEGIEGDKAKEMVNKALNNHHQSFRQLSRSKGHLLNVLKHPNLKTRSFKQCYPLQLDFNNLPKKLQHCHEVNLFC